MTSWHGTKGNPKWPKPSLVAASNEANRADQGNTIKANEYLDQPDVLAAKVNMLADMIKQSKLCTAYTGAGLSKSSGIPDYATKASNSVVGQGPKLKSNLDAQPTYAHCALAAMERSGHLQHWVQQNHDGLPQKAGYPQEKINEIHGAWFDPSNPVVQFSGSLRTDLFNWMIEMEKKIDLCLCLGTSLSGMNADRVAETPAKRSAKDPSVLGTVIVNLQQTRLDDICSLRIWGTLDDVFKMLAKKLKLDDLAPRPFARLPGDVYKVPYNKDGKLDPSCTMTLDMRKGAKIIIPVKGAMNFGAKGLILDRAGDDYSYKCNLMEGERIYPRLFGAWWMQSAMEGKIPCLPVMNEEPEIVNTPFVFPSSASSSSSSSTKSQDVQMTDVNNNNNNSNNSNNNNNNNNTENTKHIEVIQSHSLVNSQNTNRHRWGLSIDSASTDLVAQVAWHLHPTFTPPTITCVEPPFEISRLGWGTFTVTADVTLKPEYGSHTLKVKHELNFNGGGDNVKTTRIPIPSN